MIKLKQLIENNNWSGEIYDYPRNVFHVTPSENVDSIMNHGLIPKQEQKISEHESGIFFVNSVIDAWNIAYQLNQFFGRRKKDMTILKVKIPESHKMFRDSQAQRENAVFVIEAIPPKNISIESEIPAETFLSKNYKKAYKEKFY